MLDMRSNSVLGIWCGSRLLCWICILTHFPCCRFEDYVGQLEAATAVAGLSAEKERAPAVKDRKELAAIQEVQLLP